MPNIQTRKRSPFSSRVETPIQTRPTLPKLPFGDAEAAGATDCRRLAGSADGANPFGIPGYLRRLSDKILAAFNHAYAAGEEEIAYRLHDALVAAEQQARLQHPERRIGTALQQAGLWVAYVDARNLYLGVAQDRAADRTMVEAAEARMAQSYRNWSAA